MKKYVFFALAVLFLIAGFSQGGNAMIGGAALFVLFLALGIRSVKADQLKAAQESRKQAPAPVKPAPVSAPAPAPSPRQSYTFVSFRVAGVTFKNDDGSDRQTILRHLKFQDEPYVTDGSVTVSIEPFEYQGSPAFMVLVNGYRIGSVPSDKIQDVQAAVDHQAEVSAIDFYGGTTREGDRHNFGCEITLRYPAS